MPRRHALILIILAATLAVIIDRHIREDIVKPPTLTIQKRNADMQGTLPLSPGGSFSAVQPVAPGEDM